MRMRETDNKLLNYNKMYGNDSGIKQKKGKLQEQTNKYTILTKWSEKTKGSSSI